MLHAFFISARPAILPSSDPMNLNEAHDPKDSGPVVDSSLPNRGMIFSEIGLISFLGRGSLWEENFSHG
jgi:hypothetical protein